ncbi:MAG: macro domain-containing protein [Ruminococcaceae bacterium]|nr:macro domain-containing protein [Oscillospiraceae bacterium]
MPLKIIRQDITKIECDAIVNPTNEKMMPGGGADLAIHRAAGEALLEHCKKLGGCEVGGARITPAFDLPCKYVIHTAGPDWHKEVNPEELLVSCYKSSLHLALEYKCESVAFPLIASGTYGFPKDRVLKIATKVISDFLFDNEMDVLLVVFDKEAYEISQKVYSDVSSYIDDHYVEESNFERSCPITEEPVFMASIAPEAPKGKKSIFKALGRKPRAVASAAKEGTTLDEMIRNMDKGFADTLFYYIDKKGVTDVECYKRSNVDKKTFSKIKCNKDYRPSKITAVSFAIGLRLNIEETNHLLNTVGMSLSHSSLFDVIIEYFITSGEYESVFDVNEVLYKFDQSLLGV